MRNDIIKKIVMAVIIVAVILILIFIGREVAVKFFGLKLPSLSKSAQINVKKIELETDDKNIYSHIVTDKYIYFVSTNSVIIIDDGGNEKAKMNISVEKPILTASGEYVLVGDAGGKNIYLLKNSELVKNVTTIKNIKNISVNSSGNFVAVTEGDMHKRDVILYNPKGEEIFIWNSGNKLVFDAVVANNNKNVIISSLDTQASQATTVLNFYNVSKAEPIATETIENEIIADLSVFENYVYCIGEAKTMTYSVTGSKKGEIPYNTKSLQAYKINKNGIIMTFSQASTSNKRYNLEVYSESGHLKNSYNFEYASQYLDASASYITIGRKGLISLLDYDGREKKLLDPGIDIADLRFIGNTGKLVGFTADGIYIFGI